MSTKNIEVKPKQNVHYSHKYKGKMSHITPSKIIARNTLTFFITANGQATETITSVAWTGEAENIV